MAMHSIVYVPPVEDWENSRLEGLQVYAETASLAPGDTIWLITRMPGRREVPGLCGRLVAAERPGRGGAEPVGAASPESRADADRGLSERCRPIPCGVIRSWPAWRAPFGGLAALTQEQGRYLDRIWAASRGRRETR